MTTTTDHISQSTDNPDLPHMSSISKEPEYQTTDNTVTVRSVISTSQTVKAISIDNDEPSIKSTAFDNDFESTTESSSAESGNGNEFEHPMSSVSLATEDSSSKITTYNSIIETSTIAPNSFVQSEITTIGRSTEDSPSTTESTTTDSQSYYTTTSFEVETKPAFTNYEGRHHSTKAQIMPTTESSNNTLDESNYTTKDLHSNVVTTQMTTPYTNLEDYSSIDSDVILQSSSTIHVESTIKPYTKKTVEGNHSSTVSTENKNTKTPENQRNIIISNTGITLVQDLPSKNITTYTLATSTNSLSDDVIHHIKETTSEFTKTTVASEVEYSKITSDNVHTDKTTNIPDQSSKANFNSKRTSANDIENSTPTSVVTSDATSYSNLHYTTTKIGLSTTQSPVSESVIEITTEKLFDKITTLKSVVINTPHSKETTKLPIKTFTNKLKTLEEYNKTHAETSDITTQTISNTFDFQNTAKKTETFKNPISQTKTTDDNTVTREFSTTEDTLYTNKGYNLETSTLSKDMSTNSYFAKSTAEEINNAMETDQTKSATVTDILNPEDITVTEHNIGPSTETDKRKHEGTMETNFELMTTETVRSEEKPIISQTTDIGSNTMETDNYMKETNPWRATDITTETNWIGTFTTEKIGSKKELTPSQGTAIETVTTEIAMNVGESKPTHSTDMKVLHTTQSLNIDKELISSKSSNSVPVTTETVKNVGDVSPLITDFLPVTTEVIQNDNINSSPAIDIVSVTSEKPMDYYFEPITNQATDTESVTTETASSVGVLTSSTITEVGSDTTEKVTTVSALISSSTTDALNITETTQNVENDTITATDIESVTTETQSFHNGPISTLVTDNGSILVSSTITEVFSDITEKANTIVELVSSGIMDVSDVNETIKNIEMVSVTSETHGFGTETTSNQVTDNPVTTNTIKHIDVLVLSTATDVGSDTTEKANTIIEFTSSRSTNEFSVTETVQNVEKHTLPAKGMVSHSSETQGFDNGATSNQVTDSPVITNTIKNKHVLVSSTATEIGVDITEKADTINEMTSLRSTDAFSVTETVQNAEMYTTPASEVVSVNLETESFDSGLNSNQVTDRPIITDKVINIDSMVSSTVTNVGAYITEKANTINEFTSLRSTDVLTGTEIVQNIEMYTLPATNVGSVTSKTQKIDNEQISNQATNRGSVITETISDIDVTTTEFESHSTDKAKTVIESTSSKSTDTLSGIESAQNIELHTSPATVIKSVTLERQDINNAPTPDQITDTAVTTETVKNIEVLTEVETNITEIKITDEFISSRTTDFVPVTTESTQYNEIISLPAVDARSVTTEPIKNLDILVPSTSTEVGSDTIENIKSTDDFISVRSTDFLPVTTESILMSSSTTYAGTITPQTQDFNNGPIYNKTPANRESLTTEMNQNINILVDSSTTETITDITKNEKINDGFVSSLTTDVTDTTETIQNAEINSSKATTVVSNAIYQENKSIPTEKTDGRLATTETFDRKNEYHYSQTTDSGTILNNTSKWNPSQATGDGSMPTTLAEKYITSEKTKIESITTEPTQYFNKLSTSTTTDFESVITDTEKYFEGLPQVQHSDKGTVTATSLANNFPVKITDSLSLTTDKIKKQTTTLVPLSTVTDMAEPSSATTVTSLGMTKTNNEDHITSYINTGTESTESSTSKLDFTVKTSQKIITTQENSDQKTIATLKPSVKETTFKNLEDRVTIADSQNQFTLETPTFKTDTTTNRNLATNAVPLSSSSLKEMLTDTITDLTKSDTKSSQTETSASFFEIRTIKNVVKEDDSVTTKYIAANTIYTSVETDSVANTNGPTNFLEYSTKPNNKISKDSAENNTDVTNKKNSTTGLPDITFVMYPEKEKSTTRLVPKNIKASTQKSHVDAIYFTTQTNQEKSTSIPDVGIPTDIPMYLTSVASTTLPETYSPLIGTMTSKGISITESNTIDYATDRIETTTKTNAFPDVKSVDKETTLTEKFSTSTPIDFSETQSTVFESGIVTEQGFQKTSNFGAVTPVTDKTTNTVSTISLEQFNTKATKVTTSYQTGSVTTVTLGPPHSHLTTTFSTFSTVNSNTGDSKLFDTTAITIDGNLDISESTTETIITIQSENISPSIVPNNIEVTWETPGISLSSGFNADETEGLTVTHHQNQFSSTSNDLSTTKNVVASSTSESGSTTLFSYTDTTKQIPNKEYTTVFFVPDQNITGTIENETLNFNKTLHTESSHSYSTLKAQHTSTSIISTSTESLSSRRKGVDISAWTDTTLITDMTTTETTVQSTDLFINTSCKINTTCPTNKACLNGVCQNPCQTVGSGCTKNESCIVVNHAAVCVCDDATGIHCSRKGRLTRCFV